MDIAGDEVAIARDTTETARSEILPVRLGVVTADHEVSLKPLEVLLGGAKACVALTLMSSADLEQGLACGLVGLGFVSGRQDGDEPRYKGSEHR